ncbi:universal stress protein [Salinibacter altiplanensis]|uniref:universal stress protein n=1 Tax=Salinibacter altiplanensis TaxID=1803181 RepID=UPI000C9FD99B|nr:universal stress protein [Salinibacter altiplanensis]
MYDVLLIPVDLSSANDHVLDRARALSTPGDTRMLLHHAIETLQDEAPGEMDDFYADLQQEAEKKLGDWASTLAEDGFDVDSLITYGEQGPEITRVAEEENADLLVMRSHRVNRDDPDSPVGTVSHQVAVFAPCSVYLVRP